MKTQAFVQILKVSSKILHTHIHKRLLAQICMLIYRDSKKIQKQLQNCIYTPNRRILSALLTVKHFRELGLSKTECSKQSEFLGNSKKKFVCNQTLLIPEPYMQTVLPVDKGNISFTSCAITDISFLSWCCNLSSYLLLSGAILIKGSTFLLSPGLNQKQLTM